MIGETEATFTSSEKSLVNKLSLIASQKGLEKSAVDFLTSLGEIFVYTCGFSVVYGFAKFVDSRNSYFIKKDV